MLISFNASWSQVLKYHKAYLARDQQIMKDETLIEILCLGSQAIFKCILKELPIDICFLTIIYYCQEETAMILQTQ